MKSGLKVIAPATISNLACGFDILGMALDLPCDEIIGGLTDKPGVTISEITGYKKGISPDPIANTAGVAVNALLNHLGETGRGISLRIHKHIQGGSGLGSSAASAVAAVMVTNELLNHPLEKRELIPFAIQGELLASGTPVGDNVVPSMLGGLMLIRDITTYDYHRIYTPPGLFITVLLPDFVITTQASRSVLQSTVPLPTMIQQSANLGAFIIAMNTGDLDLIARSMKDLIIEPQRAPLIPHFDLLKESALKLGALGCSISGSGPAVFALCQEKTQAEELSVAMKKIYDTYKIEARSFVCGINPVGAILK
ncbi:MAG TPA: homoserine kinase, partial [Saprospiraceae bacterium]|nr:homoserine kinase [Saprospiraceae bacterium]